MLPEAFAEKPDQNNCKMERKQFICGKAEEGLFDVIHLEDVVLQVTLPKSKSLAIFLHFQTPWLLRSGTPTLIRLFSLKRQETKELPSIQEVVE